MDHAFEVLDKIGLYFFLITIVPATVLTTIFLFGVGDLSLFWIFSPLFILEFSILVIMFMAYWLYYHSSEYNDMKKRNPQRNYRTWKWLLVPFTPAMIILEVLAITVLFPIFIIIFIVDNFPKIVKDSFLIWFSIIGENE